MTPKGMSNDTQLIMGMHAVGAALREGNRVTELWLDARRRDTRVRELREYAETHQVPLYITSTEQLNQLVHQDNHQGVVARIRLPPVHDEPYLKALLKRLRHVPFLLVLDGVQDPHNLGACLRTADAAGVQAVIIPRDKSVGLTATVCKVASGAAQTVPLVQVTNLVRTLKWLKQAGIWLIGTAGEASQSLYQADLCGPIGIVMGGEGKGLRRLTREQCDLLVKLPMAGKVESLNVSVATGVALYEAVRQRTGSRAGIDQATIS
jgi:23S rRNA (guanosine2251-2'-O)-methyltransferase